MTYSEVLSDATVAVMVLLNPDATDIEFWRVRPELADRSELTPKEEFTARQLRSVGFVGLKGLTPFCFFKEPLDKRVMNSIVAGFLEYLRVSLGGCFAEQIEGVEIAALEQLFALQDGRPN